MTIQDNKKGYVTKPQVTNANWMVQTVRAESSVELAIRMSRHDQDFTVKFSPNTMMLADVRYFILFYYDDRNIITNMGLEWVEWENIKDEACSFSYLSASVSALGREWWKLPEPQGLPPLSLEQQWLCSCCKLPALGCGWLSPSVLWALPLCFCWARFQPRGCAVGPW